MNWQYKILFVDDEPDLKPLVLQRFRREIRKGQYNCVFAENGVEALDYISKNIDLDMVVSDINMPEMDGLTLLKKIPDVNHDLRSIIVSAYGDLKNIRKAMNLGAFDFVVKPIDFEDLRLTIARTLDRLEVWREAQSSKAKFLSISKELEIANQMQQSILPSSFPEGDNFKFFGYMKPARNVGGDFYDVIDLPENKIAAVVADVSDKGVPASLFMMASRTLLKGCSLSKVDPRVVLEDVNEFLIADNDSNMFVTLVYGVIDTQNGTFTYANGGHNPPILAKKDGSIDYIKMPRGIALGMFSGFFFDTNQLQLEDGDTLILYTDGLTEAQNADGDLFGEERLLDVVKSSLGESDDIFMENIIDSVHEFSKGEPQTDDMTFLAFRYFGAG
ncbi:MAG: SpoIIE family protein phosphatase [Rhodobacteraceae bacterium]|nr:SpoIIE family protein phosphatase [Paracoccaceae bacterium]